MTIFASATSLLIHAIPAVVPPAGGTGPSDAIAASPTGGTSVLALVGSDAQLSPFRLLPANRGATAARNHGGITGSVWVSLRGAPNGGAGVPTLAGDQAGVRAYLPLVGRVAATMRVGTPLRQTAAADAAFGVAWRGRHGGVIVEQRLALDRRARDSAGSGGTAAIGYAGVSELPVGRGWRIDGYGEGGAVLRGRVLPFADGSASLLHPLLTVGGMRTAVGATISGAAQTGASRVDLGPDLVVRGAVADHGYRLAVGWRARIAGNAAPGNGPSLTVGMDF